ncbi:uncharacterized protein LOC131885026 isoform X2 [Tigriopus californicus]|uniref:uncharacterized protein LOC131885026 isoform X2 n=1 Tax=Tigriopus californicus TaxID=6832 RepID=UPI0027DA57CD|nr:uncharacterized protein LOC131885026 isoform X2 [Tigriopus californicus]
MASTHLWLFCSLVLIGSVASDNVNNSTNARQKRLFSIFNVVTFKNDPCTTTGTGNLGGTCMTSSECASKSGSASGNCAAGFGVCCLFIVSEECGSTITINQNCTYIRNNGNPTPDMTAGQTCTFDFKRICDNLCQIRLDFRTLSTLVSATGTCGTAEDAVTVSSPFSSSANAFPPTVCGSLTGQHMYFETGTSGDSAGTLSIAKGTGAGSRTFDIKATYYTCDNLAKAPPGCTQYFTGQSGSFQSYNHAGGQLLTDQLYKNCFRQELGFCRLSLTESATQTPDPFLLSAPDAIAESTCDPLSHITVMTPTAAMACGGVLGKDGDTGPATVTTTSGSFEVGVRSLTAGTAGITGFNLDFEQVACA